MKKIIILIVCLFIGIMVYKKNDEIIIPSDAIRIRIIANSNSIKDIYEKKRIKEEIKDSLYNLVKDVKNSYEADNVISTNISYINNLIANKTNNFEIEYGRNYFPRKEYKGVIYPEGDYQSLVITLGNGLGDNWWCVLYPPLCLIDDNDTSNDVEYRSLIMDMLNN